MATFSPDRKRVTSARPKCLALSDFAATIWPMLGGSDNGSHLPPSLSILLTSSCHWVKRECGYTCMVRWSSMCVIKIRWSTWMASAHGLYDGFGFGLGSSRRSLFDRMRSGALPVVDNLFGASSVAVLILANGIRIPPLFAGIAWNGIRGDRSMFVSAILSLLSPFSSNFILSNDLVFVSMDIFRNGTKSAGNRDENSPTASTISHSRISAELPAIDGTLRALDRGNKRL